MNAKWNLCVNGLQTMGTTTFAALELQAGSVSMLQAISTAATVIVGSWCLGGRFFDFMHDAADRDRVAEPVRVSLN